MNDAIIGGVMAVSWTMFMLMVTDSTMAIVSGFMFFTSMLYYFREVGKRG